MPERELPLAAADAVVRPIRAVRPAGLETLLRSLGEAEAGFLRAAGFAARGQELMLLPGTGGLSGAVLGLGEDRSPHAFGDLAFRLPAGSAWRIEPGDFDSGRAVLGFLLGAYRYQAFKAPARESALLSVTEADRPALATAQAIWMVRNLVNTPANLLGPSELADAAAALAHQYGAGFTRCTGEALDSAYPTIATVGAGAARPPVVGTLRWRGSGADDASPLVSLCGKGVCFDSGGLDLKPSAGMLNMKKDMGGAATVLGLARLIMQADLPLRLVARLGCVENSVSGRSMRPRDVVRTRRGLSVEIGNTDAEGRLVLCDLLAEAADERPALLLDFATLTGAARVALGPDVPAFFTGDEAWAADLAAAAERQADPLWRLPFWDSYDSWLDSSIADLNNVSSKPAAGAIVAALFLRRFVPAGLPWVHVDLYAWNDSTQPGRPEGGEAQVMRAAYSAIEKRLVDTILD